MNDYIKLNLSDHATLLEIADFLRTMKNLIQEEDLPRIVTDINLVVSNMNIRTK